MGWGGGHQFPWYSNDTVQWCSDRTRIQGLDGWGGGGEGVGKCLPPDLHVHGEALDVLCLY